MEGLIRPLVYALADSLGMELFVDKTTGAVTGEVTRDVNVGGLRLSVPMKVVSSNLAKGGVYMLIVKVIGNMAVFAVAKKVGAQEVVDLHILNIAKTQRLSGFLEKTPSASVNDVLRSLQPGIVRSYVKASKTRWELAA